MIRFEVKSGVLTPSLPEDATSEELEVAKKIADNLNGVTTGSTTYKSLLQSLDQQFQSQNIKYQDYIDQQTISEIEGFYEKATNIKPWDSTKDGASLDTFDSKFYAGVVPDKVNEWKNASKEITFGGQQIANLDITKKYPTLDSYLHSDYTFVGKPAGLPGKQKTIDTYTETLRAPTDAEKQVLRETLLGTSEEKPYSLIEATTQAFVDVQGEKAFSALATDALKRTLDEYARAKKQEQLMGALQGMGLDSPADFKQNIKDSILGDFGTGGFLSFGQTGKLQDSLSKSLDKSLGIGSSVAYNWQKWFDNTLSKRYQDMKEIKDPTDANKTYTLEKEFVDNFVNNYLKPRFDTSKSINEFVSYMDVTNEEQNVLQTQLASSALRDLANNQAQTYLDELGTKTITKEFDPAFYWNPELLSGTDVTTKQGLYETQKQDVQNNWNKRESDEVVKDGKTWKQLAYEYGLDVNNKDDFARLHYQILGKNAGYDPVADSYTRKDLAAFINGDLTNALQAEKNSLNSPVFLDFVTAQSKAQELVDKLNINELPEEYAAKLKEMGYDTKTTPEEEIKNVLVQALSTDPALQIREQIKQLNEQDITPTQKELGYGYIQREEDKEVKKPAGGSALYNVFKKSGYEGTEAEFYTDFFPGATEEDKNLGVKSLSKAGTKQGVQALMGFEMPDMSDPFAAMGSFSKMLDADSEEATKAETYTPKKKSQYFDFFPDEEDEGAPSYSTMTSSAGFGSLFG